MKKSFVVVALVAIAIGFAAGVKFSQHQQQNELTVVSAYWDKNAGVLICKEGDKEIGKFPFTENSNPLVYLQENTSLGINEINRLYQGEEVFLAFKK